MIAATKSPYFVKPDDASSLHCPADQTTLTIDEYAQHMERYFTTGSTFVFLAGNHTLHYNIYLDSVSKITFRGNSTAHIVWTERNAFYCNDITNLTIEGLSFQENSTVDNEGSALVVFNSREVLITSSIFHDNGDSAIFCLNTTLVIYNCRFEKNSGDYGGALYLGGSNVILTDTKFTNNKASSVGGAIYAHNGTIMTLNSSEFAHNYGQSAGGAVSIDQSTLILLGCNFFDDNYASKFGVSSLGGALDVNWSDFFIYGSAYFFNNRAVTAGAIWLVSSNAIISGREIVFKGNVAYFHYGGAILFKSTSVIINTSSIHFINNSAGLAGGAVNIQELTKFQYVNISGNFRENSAAKLFGGAIFMENVHKATLKNIIVSNNSNSAVCCYKSTIHFEETTYFERNTGKLGGAVYFSYSSVFFSGVSTFKGNTAYTGGALFALRTNIRFKGEVKFLSNTAENGGAMHFKTSSSMTLEPETNLTTMYNHAFEYGGGIYHEDIVTPSQCQYNGIGNEYLELPTCFIQLDLVIVISLQPLTNIKLSSHFDTADKDGNFLFGGLLDRCQLVERDSRIDEYLYNEKIHPYNILKSRGVINITQHNDLTEAVTSEPYGLCFCMNDSVIDCTGQWSIDVYRGERFTVSLIAITQGGSTSTLITAVTSRTSSVKLGQSTQHLMINQSCSTLTYNLYSTESHEELILYPNGPCRDTGIAVARVNITILPCPDAFTQTGEQCVCEERLQAYDANCTIDENVYVTLKAGSKFWIGVLYSINRTYQGLILYESCPTEYCQSETLDLTLDNLNIQCNSNREGILCGGCIKNYSLLFGSSLCKECSNTYLVLLLPFLLAGVFLVAFLSILRLTVATGMINSVILYCNIVQANRMIFYPEKSAHHFLTVFIAWTNLDLGFETCFYDGMTAYAQTWLQFAFPAYVWIIISIIIITSRYSVRVSKLIGHNPIAVLATLFLMSYTKILKIIIEVYSTAQLEYPDNKTVTVWLKDGNMPYLQSWHLLLTVVTSLILVFLFLPYTLLLLLGYKLYRFSGRKHMRWLYRLKPLLDSYYAPYKTHTRYWTGFLLLVRCALYIVFSYYSLGATSKSLLAIIITFTAIIVIAWLSVRIYKRTHNNIIEASIYLNLIVLSAVTSAELESPALVHSLVGTVFITMMAIIAYHFHILYISKSTIWKKIETKVSSVIESVRWSTDTSPVLPLAKSSSDDPHKIVSKTVIDLREPLLESSQN